MNFVSAFYRLAFFFSVCNSAAQYSQLWLSYLPVSPSFRDSVPWTSLSCTAGDSLLLASACGELSRGLTLMLQRNFTASTGSATASASASGVSVILLSPASLLPVWPPNPALEGFSISISSDGATATVSSQSAQGALNGVWRLLNLVQRESSSLLSPGVADASTPSSPLRMWDLWDNLDGSVERGYAGSSVLYPLNGSGSGGGGSAPLRVVDYARILSSMGLNAIVLDNVNACGAGNEAILSSTNLALLAPLVSAFFSYGLHSLLTPCWTSPQTVGGLNTSDPHSAVVTSWWEEKIAEVVDTFPPGAFRGLLFKGDTEGQPGPGVYNLTELEGANYFGKLLAPASAICIWRAFSHPPGGRDMPLDQALYQYNRFIGWNGATEPNVVLQTKNGPFDFQVREPVHSLFGRMTQTNIIAEFEATPEYIGQDIHAIALPLQWATYLSFDLCDGGNTTTCSNGVNIDTTLGGVVSRGVFSGMAAVSNLGNFQNWTGHVLSGVNTFGFGRMAWDPKLQPLAVVREWAEVQFPTSAPIAIDGLVDLLGDTWEAYENFTASLGWGFVCAGNHYDMAPGMRTDYTNASKTHVGYNRGVGGYGATYNGKAGADFTTLEACPEELLLGFWNVPYTHRLQGEKYGGKTVLEWIYDSHAAGAVTAAGFVERWGELKGGLNLSAFVLGGGATDAEVFVAVQERLTKASYDAAVFSSTVTTYFQKLTA